MLHRFIFALFSKGSPATNRESPKGEGRERGGFHPTRWRFLLGAASAKNIPLSPPGKGKGEVFTLGLPNPWQSAAKDDRVCSEHGMRLRS